MPDAFCAVCGEPYGHGGRHYTTTDMSLWEWFQFLDGRGCPCCQGEGRRTPEMRDRWLYSRYTVFEGDPPEPLDPDAQWTDDYHAGTNTMLTNLASEVLGYVARGRMEWVERGEEPEGVLPLEPGEPRRLYVLFDLEGVPARPGDDPLLRANHEAFLDQPGVDNAYSLVGMYDWALHIGSIKMEDGWLPVERPNLQEVSQFMDTARALDDYPCLDDQRMSELEAEAADQRFDHIVQDVSSQLDDLMFHLMTDRLESLVAGYQEAHGTDVWPSADQIFEWAEPQIELPGYEACQSRLAPERYILYPTIMAFDQTLPFAMIADEKGVEIVQQLPAHELGDPCWVAGIPWDVRKQVYRWLADN